jgi:hypothetical protein
MATSDCNKKKRKAPDRNSNTNDDATTVTTDSRKKADNNSNNNGSATTTASTTTYSPVTLAEIRSRIVALMDRVPPVEGDVLAREQSHEWAAALQAVIEEFNLLLSLVSAATYKWGTDRSGAADQNLGLLSGELMASQDQISSTVTPRLTNILAPVVDLVIDRTEIIITSSSSPKGDDDKGDDDDNDTSNNNNNNKTVKQNYFAQKQVDPEFLNLCRTILGRNAKLIRQVCLANFSKVAQCIGDFLQAQEKDSQHDSRGFSY